MPRLQLMKAMMEAQGSSPEAVRANVRPCSRLQRLIDEAAKTERQREALEKKNKADRDAALEKLAKDARAQVAEIDRTYGKPGQGCPPVKPRKKQESVDAAALRRGTEIERAEHGRRRKNAREIALDHLEQDPEAYAEPKRRAKKAAKAKAAKTPAKTRAKRLSTIAKEARQARKVAKKATRMARKESKEAVEAKRAQMKAEREAKLAERKAAKKAAREKAYRPAANEPAPTTKPAKEPKEPKQRKERAAKVKSNVQPSAPKPPRVITVPPPASAKRRSAAEVRADEAFVADVVPFDALRDLPPPANSRPSVDPNAVDPTKDAALMESFQKALADQMATLRRGKAKPETTESLKWYQRLMGKKPSAPPRADLVNLIREQQGSKYPVTIVPYLAGMYGASDERVLGWFKEYKMCPGIHAESLVTECRV